MPQKLFGSFETIEDINTNKTFGMFVTAKYDDAYEVSSHHDGIAVSLKLFNLITLKKIVIVNNDINLYAGGEIVGFTLNGDGVVVLGKSSVASEGGEIITTEKTDIKKGDIITKINGEKVSSIADICRIANKTENQNKDISLELQRDDKIVLTTIFDSYDKNSGLFKLGLWVKDDISGIGTLTFVREDNNRFGALGHSVSDNDTKTKYNINNGQMFKCNVIGIKKGSKGNTGEMKGFFLQGKNNQIGTLDKNCEYGIFGEVAKDYKGECELKAGGRLFAKAGKAYIRSCIEGNTYKDYEIEIIKTNYQSRSSEKSMVIKITDKELLAKTGGIIQGMSGSPIIQNGRIIGAVTHVFVNDPTKGFGIYLDWMIEQ